MKMEITIRQGSNADLEGVIGLLQDVKAAMEHPEWFYLDSPEEIREMMADGTMRLWVAEDGNTLAGILYILFPGLQEFNYGYDLGLTQEELLRVVSMDTAAVRPEYRGMGLQGKLIQAAEDSLQGESAHILLCTIHPENVFSLNNALKQGYVVQKEVPKYGSTRYVLRKNLKK